MIPKVLRVWLLSALLLSLVPGCVPLRGPRTVTGTVGESLSVPCQYEEKFKTNNKYWCRVSLLLLCNDIVMTSSSEEARNGRVSIRDHPDNLTFTVTLEKLTLEDAGTYRCGVDTSLTQGSLGIDKNFKVELSVVPRENPGLSPESGTDSLVSSTSSLVHTQPSVTTKDTIPAPSPQPRSLLSSLYFWVLVFLELPLLLSMLAAILWVSRPRRCSEQAVLGPVRRTNEVC